MTKEDTLTDNPYLSYFLNSEWPLSLWEFNGDCFTLVNNNDAAMEMFHKAGTEKKHIIGKDLRLITPGIQKTSRYQEYIKVMKTGDDFTKHEAYYVSPNQNEYYLDVHAFKVGKNYLGLMSTDITEKVITEKILRETASTLEQVESITCVGSWVIDLEKRTYHLSEKAQQIFGLKAQKTNNFRELLMRIDEDEHMNLFYMLSAIIQGDDIIPNFKFKIYKNEKPIIIRSNIKVVKKQGKAIKIIGTLEDITEKINRKRVNEIIKAIEKSQEKYDGLRLLIGGIAHDFNNVLQVLIGNAENIKIADSKEEMESDLNKVIKASNDIAEIIKSLVSFSLVSINLSTGKINSIVEDEIDKNKTIMDNIQFTTDLSSNVPDAKFDISLIRNVILNLFLNARNALEGVADKHIKVQTGIETIKNNEIYLHELSYITFKIKPGNYIYFQVTDNGKGIESEHFRQLFTPYFSTHADVGKRTRGLGLANVLATIQNHHGFITVKSKLGVGTTFTIYLPL